MKCMRPIRTGGVTTEPYHIPKYARDARQEVHSVETLCGKEIKTLYNNWDIKEDPDKTEMCPDCYIAWKNKMTLKK